MQISMYECLINQWTESLIQSEIKMILCTWCAVSEYLVTGTCSNTNWWETRSHANVLWDIRGKVEKSKPKLNKNIATLLQECLATNSTKTLHRTNINLITSNDKKKCWKNDAIVYYTILCVFYLNAGGRHGRSIASRGIEFILWEVILENKSVVRNFPVHNWNEPDGKFSAPNKTKKSQRIEKLFSFHLVFVLSSWMWNRDLFVKCVCG